MSDERYAETHLDRNTVAQGKIRTKGDMRIEGLLEGEARTEGCLILSPSGRVQGTIESREARIEGSVEGVVEAHEIVRLAETCTVNSTVIAPQLVVQNCTRVQGYFVITPNAAEREKNRTHPGITPPSRPPDAPAPLKAVTISITQDGAQRVQLTGSFNDWDEGKAVSLRPSPDGRWSADLRLPPGTYEYRVLIDGKSQPDPDNPQKVPNSYGGENSVLTVP
ncbi:MAG TPA: polymer-forming cytoskeletal protein [bacterium]|nr:polymer-forming cytoskeletal protein [bacterium]